MTFNIEFNALVPNTCHCVVLCERKLLNLAVYKLGRGIPQRMCLMAHLSSSAHKDLVHMFVSLGRNREAYNVPAIRCLNIEDTHHGDLDNIDKDMPRKKAWPLRVRPGSQIVGTPILHLNR